VTNVNQDITPTPTILVVSHVQLERIQTRVVKQQMLLVFPVKRGPIPRPEVPVALIFAMHANQVGILQQHRIPLDVMNARQDTCKTPQALVHVNSWVKMPFDWEVVLRK
jgi:hypothetical protein